MAKQTLCSIHQCPTVQIHGREVCPIEWVQAQAILQPVVDFISGDPIRLVFANGAVLPVRDLFWEGWQEGFVSSENPQELLDQIDRMVLRAVFFQGGEERPFSEVFSYPILIYYFDRSDSLPIKGWIGLKEVRTVLE